MAEKKESCARCKQVVDADDLIQCPACNDECCEDCIAGVGVDCFQCEDADVENSDPEDDIEEADFEEDDTDIEEDHG